MGGRSQLHQKVQRPRHAVEHAVDRQAGGRERAADPCCSQSDAWFCRSEPRMWRTVSLSMAVCIAGCDGKEPPLTRLDQGSEQEFTFEARADLEHPEDDAKAEATRMEWLSKALADNDLCPNGYTITGRKVVAAPQEG